MYRICWVLLLPDDKGSCWVPKDQDNKVWYNVVWKTGINNTVYLWWCDITRMRKNVAWRMWVGPMGYRVVVQTELNNTVYLWWCGCSHKHDDEGGQENKCMMYKTVYRSVGRTGRTGRPVSRTVVRTGIPVGSSWCKQDNKRGEVGCSSRQAYDVTPEKPPVKGWYYFW